MTTLPPAESGHDTGPLPLPLLRALREALASLRYGTVELTVHDGRVVQLERREKVRLETAVTEHRR